MPRVAYVLLVQVFSSMVAYWAAKFAAKVTTCPQSSSESAQRRHLRILFNAKVAATFNVQVCIQSVGFSLPLTLVTPCTLVTVISMCGARAYDKVAR